MDKPFACWTTTKKEKQDVLQSFEESHMLSLQGNSVTAVISQNDHCTVE